jgi:DNA-binding Lrp family transcriptional regulator
MEAMANNDQSLDLNMLTVADIDRMLEENEAQRRQLLAARKQIVVIEKARQAMATALNEAGGGTLIQFPTRSSKSDSVIHRAPAMSNPHMPKPGSIDERVFEAISPLPLTVEALSEKLGESANSLTKRLNELEAEGLVGHFTIDRRKPTKHRGVSTPLSERYFFWRPKAELDPSVRRTIITGLLMRKWWTNAELVDAAKAKSFPEIRAVDNMVRTIRRAENVWRQMADEGKWMYWMREDRGEPSKEMDGRDWGPKSKHLRHAQATTTKKPRNASNHD